MPESVHHVEIAMPIRKLWLQIKYWVEKTLGDVYSFHATLVTSLIDQAEMVSFFSDQVIAKIWALKLHQKILTKSEIVRVKVLEDIVYSLFICANSNRLSWKRTRSGIARHGCICPHHELQHSLLDPHCSFRLSLSTPLTSPSAKWWAYMPKDQTAFVATLMVF